MIWGQPVTNTVSVSSVANNNYTMIQSIPDKVPSYIFSCLRNHFSQLFVTIEI